MAIALSANRREKLAAYKPLVFAILAVLLLSWLSSFPVMENMEWYNQLQKPDFNPPSWVFGIVWPILYMMMTYAAWLVWQMRTQKQEQVEEALALFTFQLVINLMWTPFFFGAQSPWLGLLWLGMLWFLVMLMLIAFQSVSRIAMALLLPYAAWTSFALYLNYTIWRLNS